MAEQRTIETRLDDLIRRVERIEGRLGLAPPDRPAPDAPPPPPPPPPPSTGDPRADESLPQGRETTKLRAPALAEGRGPTPPTEGRPKPAPSVLTARAPVCGREVTGDAQRSRHGVSTVASSRWFDRRHIAWRPPVKLLPVTVSEGGGTAPIFA